MKKIASNKQRHFRCNDKYQLTLDKTHQLLPSEKKRRKKINLFKKKKIVKKLRQKKLKKKNNELSRNTFRSRSNAIKTFQKVTKLRLHISTKNTRTQLSSTWNDNGLYGQFIRY